MRQGNTVSVTIAFDAPLGDMDLKVGIYDQIGQEVFASYLSDDDSAISHLRDNIYSVEISHDVTKALEGKYIFDMLLVSNGEVVTCVENPIEIVFKPAKIATNVRL